MKKLKEVVILPQEKTITDLYRIAQKRNCDDFVKIIMELGLVIVNIVD